MTNHHSVVVADFDGVFVRQSEFFKRDAWPQVFQATYGDRYVPHLERAHHEYEQSKKGDRFTILRATYKGLGEPEDRLDDLVALGAKAFDGIVQQAILNAGADARVVAAFEDIAKEYPLYLNSATPLDALRQTVSAIGIGHLFKDVLGRPRTKVENFRSVAQREGVDPGAILFVGDSQSDFAAAEEFGCSFIGWANEWNEWVPESKSYPIITEMTELKSYI